MLIVTGATGPFGRAAVEALLNRVPADRIGVSVRDPAKAADLAARGVRVRRGDFDDAASLADAFEGAQRVLIVSGNDIGPTRVRQHRSAITAAAKAGAKQILYTSTADFDAASPFLPEADHVDAEKALAESGVAYTALRNGLYTELLPQVAGPGMSGGTVAVPADGPTAYVSRLDLAEAAAIVLADGGYENQAVVLTGPEPLDFAAVAAIAADITGRPTTRQVISDDAFHAGLLAHGLPQPVADLVASLFPALRQGRFALVTPTLGQLLGRPPKTVRETLSVLLQAGK